MEYPDLDDMNTLSSPRLGMFKSKKFSHLLINLTDPWISKQIICLNFYFIFLILMHAMQKLLKLKGLHKAEMWSASTIRQKVCMPIACVRLQKSSCNLKKKQQMLPGKITIKNRLHRKTKTIVFFFLLLFQMVQPHTTMIRNRSFKTLSILYCFQSPLTRTVN